jgi:hypothetical protein
MHKMIQLKKVLITLLIVMFFSIPSYAESLKFVESKTKGISISECKKVFEEGKRINFRDSVNSNSSINWFIYEWKVYGFMISNNIFACDLRGHYE